MDLITICYITWLLELNSVETVEKRRWFIAFSGRQRIQADLTMLRLSAAPRYLSAWLLKDNKPTKLYLNSKPLAIQLIEA